MSSSSIDLIAEHILSVLTESRPLCVALQGPQGSGKSYLSSRVKNLLESSPHLLRVVVLSIDDLYLPHSGLTALAVAHPDNILWEGRGQPGTHDVDLGINILTDLKAGSGTRELPRFDKSLHAGQGDRLPMDGSGTIISQPPPFDVVLLEGWCVGFNPVSLAELQNTWENQWLIECRKLGLERAQVGRLEDLEAVNGALLKYTALWDFFDVFIQLRPCPPESPSFSDYGVIYAWRLEQEHHMKAVNGGKGMSDEQVKRFIDRYIPGYVFFGNHMLLSPTHPHGAAKPRRWMGKGLSLWLDESRRVVRTATF